MTRLTLAILLSFLASYAFAQSNQNDTFTISTYYPSPRGIYKTLEVKHSLAIGEVRNDPKIFTMENLSLGQMYVGNSIILKSQAYDPPNGKEGQIIYVGPDEMLKFHNGTGWVNATAPPPPLCTNGQICRPNDWVAPSTPSARVVSWSLTACADCTLNPDPIPPCAADERRLELGVLGSWYVSTPACGGGCQRQTYYAVCYK